MGPKDRNSARNAILAAVVALAMLTSVHAVHAVASAGAPAVRALAQAAQPQAKIFSGTVVKNGDQFVLSDVASKLSYVLDDAKKASQFEGKHVKVTGTVDVASNTIHVETIQEIA